MYVHYYFAVRQPIADRQQFESDYGTAPFKTV